jgi:hypothetical protein
MRRIPTLRTPVSKMQRTLKPYNNKSHRILFYIKGPDAMAAIYRLNSSERSLHELRRCGDLYIPVEIQKVRVPVRLPPIPSSYLAAVEGGFQKVDTPAYKAEWRRLNRHYYPHRSKLDLGLVG